MARVDSLCALVEVSTAFTGTVSREGSAPHYLISRIVRTYESRERAEEDLELLTKASTGSRYRIDDVDHIER